MFDPAKHCARCLLGGYSRHIPFGRVRAGSTYAGDLHERDAPYLYLCGVTPEWAENLHIAFEPAERERIEYEDANARVVIEGARRLNIPPLPVEMSPAFATCRNYQFGYQYLRDRDEQ